MQINQKWSTDKFEYLNNIQSYKEGKYKLKCSKQAEHFDVWKGKMMQKELYQKMNERIKKRRRVWIFKPHQMDWNWEIVLFKNDIPSKKLPATHQTIWESGQKDWKSCEMLTAQLNRNLLYKYITRGCMLEPESVC